MRTLVGALGDRDVQQVQHHELRPQYQDPELLKLTVPQGVRILDFR